MADTPTPRDRNEERAIRAQRQKDAKAAQWAKNLPIYPRKTT